LINEERLSFLQVRVGSNDILDCIDPNSSSKEDIEYITKERIAHVLSYSIIKRSTFFYEIVKNKKMAVIDALLNILDFLSPKDVPFMFPEVLVDGCLDTAFDCAFSLEQPRGTVQRMLNLMLKIDETGSLYSETIERNLERMIAADVDLAAYF
jgi:hypothetical protein